MFQFSCMFQEIAKQSTNRKLLKDHLFPTILCDSTESPSPETHLHIYTHILAKLRFSEKGQVENQVH